MGDSDWKVEGSKHTTVKMLQRSRDEEHEDVDVVEKKRSKITGKDKLIVETRENEKDRDPCGICLAEEGVNPRGKMDCCDHYFCFACIVEWAKVESRCPTCRQRFSSISRPSCQSGSARGRGRTLRVPLRNQVHVPTDEDIPAVQDPYANVFCSECNSKDDDNLLLLCDLCDSAAHTYCVGLGRTVPTGEWYCHECEASGNVNSDREDDDFVLEFHNEITSSSSTSIGRAYLTAETLSRGGPQAALSSSLLSRHVSRHVSNTSQLRGLPRRVIHRQSPRISNTAWVSSSRSSECITTGWLSGTASPVTSGGVRTLSGQRLLQERIQVMRENWKALQRGEMQFFSRSLCLDNRTANGAKKDEEAACKNCLKDSRQRPDNETDIKRAWAMMERAKSLGAKDLSFNGHQKAERSHLVSSFSKIDTQFSDSRLHTNSLPVERTAANSRVHSKATARNDNSVLSDRVSSVGFTLLPFSECTSTAVSKFKIGDCLDAKSSNQATIATIHEEEHVERISGNLAKMSNEGEASAKEMILSLVKIHLKPMYKTKQLGNCQFKEIARISTHTILAACGFQHSQQRVYNFQKVSCCHSDQQRQPPSLMRMCCNTCFNYYVKNVVNSVADEHLRKKIVHEK